ncbi:MAG: hypothetical protein LBG77_05280 [Dysgonamonadaceae bacterium]|jgi:hypothetical protein|nr:hypothetical protein [Dysgonamonadaceae bacterium]
MEQQDLKPYKMQEEKVDFLSDSHFEIPPGYMTGDEFVRRVKDDLTKLYKEHGLI